MSLIVSWEPQKHQKTNSAEREIRKVRNRINDIGAQQEHSETANVVKVQRNIKMTKLKALHQNAHKGAQ